MTNPYVRQAKEYRYQEIMTASPVQLLIIAYDVAIGGCQTRDLERTTHALSVLSNSLDFSQRELAYRFHSLYQWCGELARQGKWDEAAAILRDLRNAWAQADQQTNTARAATPAPPRSTPALELQLAGVR
ncbi:MAG: flagellar protein FliS [Chloroflexi bacterium]|nr:flagellar protein FliS [Chloroflexota bacterium]